MVSGIFYAWHGRKDIFDAAMAPADFIEAYSAALASQDWQQVAPLIHPEAVVTFSTGTVQRGIAAIGDAYRRNFSMIKNEEYRISDVGWIETSTEVAIYTFAYHWRGLIDGHEAGGAGRGTAVLQRRGDSWLLIAEQLTRVS